MESIKTALLILLAILVSAYLYFDKDSQVDGGKEAHNVKYQNIFNELGNDDEPEPEREEYEAESQEYEAEQDSPSKIAQEKSSYIEEYSQNKESNLSPQKNTVEELLSPSTPKEPEFYASLESDFGNEITARFRTRECPLDAYKAEGYGYLFFIDIPRSRVRGSHQAFNFKDNRAITVIGCWKPTGNAGASVKMKRKKDGKVWIKNYDTSIGNWVLVEREKQRD